MAREARTKILIFFSFICLVVLYHVLAYIGHYGYDDLLYAELANNFRHGVVDFNDHFSYRLPVILFTSLSYSILSISDFASALPAMLMTMLVLFFVFQVLKKEGYVTLVIGLAMTFFCNWFLFYSDKLMPDMYVVLSVVSSLYVMWRYRYKKRKDLPYLHALMFVSALMFGFMAKGTIVLMLPLLLYYFVFDMVKKQNKKFWIASIVLGGLCILVYFMAIWLITGDVFKRFDAIASNSYLNLCSYDKQPASIVFKRISYEFFNLIVYQGFAIGYIFVIAYAVGKKKDKIYKMKDSMSFWATSSILLLLSSNFMTISLSAYSPMCLDPRHFLFLIPVVAIPASDLVVKLFEKKNIGWGVVLLSALVALLSYFLPGNSAWLLYFPFFFMLLVFRFIKNRYWSNYLFAGAFVAILLLKPIALVVDSQRIDYAGQKKIFIENILHNEDEVIVISNEVQIRLGKYYNKFETNGNIEFVTYDDYVHDTKDSRRKLLYLNWYTRYLSGDEMTDLPYYARNISGVNNRLFKDDKLGIEIYEMNDFSDPMQNACLKITSLNEFEENVDFWSTNDKQIVSDLVFKGETSLKVDEYSSTFEYPLDSLNLNRDKVLLISSSVFCNFMDETDAKLVVSIENESGVYFWESLEVERFIKAYSNWFPVHFESSMNIEEIKKNSYLKVYLWNSDHQKAYIDNFKVELFEMD